MSLLLLFLTVGINYERLLERCNPWPRVSTTPTTPSQPRPLPQPATRSAVMDTLAAPTRYSVTDTL